MALESENIPPSSLREKLESIWQVDMINGWIDENWKDVLRFVKEMPYMEHSNDTASLMIDL